MKTIVLTATMITKIFPKSLIFLLEYRNMGIKPDSDIIVAWKGDFFNQKFYL